MQTRFLLLAGLGLVTLSSHIQATPDDTCYGQILSKTFDSGARWDFCWRTEDQEGLALSQVYYQSPTSASTRVLGEAGLSQLESTFDDGADNPMFVTTRLGLGGDNLLTLTAQDCRDGEIHAENGRNVLCSRTKHAGYLYRYSTQRQTETFEISTYSKVGPRNYQVRWRFYESGIIEPAIGLSGELPAIDQSAAQYGWPAAANGDIASSFIDHYLWRLDFDLNETADNDSVYQTSSIPSTNRLKKSRTTTLLQTEAGKRLNPDYKTFWQIADDQQASTAIGKRSYELVPAHYDQSLANPLNQSWLQHDLYITRHKACERFAADNTASGCGKHLADYVNDNQNIVKQDLVVWYRQSQHFLPRAEDSNRVGTRWSSFKLLPRDWHAQNPF